MGRNHALTRQKETMRMAATSARGWTHRIEADATLARLVGGHGREAKAGAGRPVSKHQHVRQRVQVQRVVEIPEDWLRLQGHRAQVGLLQQRGRQVLKHGFRGAIRALICRGQGRSGSVHHCGP